MTLETLPVWDEALSKEAAKIFSLRNDFLSSLAPICEEIHAEISGGTEKLKITSENSLSGTEEEIADLNYIELKNFLDKDLKLGFTGFGPHRQDIKFTLNGTDVRHYGSQGQQRTVALALKLAEVEIFKKRTGEYPILILDDVLSELDKKRQKMLIKRLDNIQTVLTATHVEKATFGTTPFLKTTIENGKIKVPKTRKVKNDGLKTE
jgi:DNA replication and repair protein RecF